MAGARGISFKLFTDYPFFMRKCYDRRMAKWKSDSWLWRLTRQSESLPAQISSILMAWESGKSTLGSCPRVTILGEVPIYMKNINSSIQAPVCSNYLEAIYGHDATIAPLPDTTVNLADAGRHRRRANAACPAAGSGRASGPVATSDYDGIYTYSNNRWHLGGIITFAVFI
ncbi:hypothetical protein ACJJTC_011129 [Scirpophaga incertulas]